MRINNSDGIGFTTLKTAAKHTNELASFSKNTYTGARKIKNQIKKDTFVLGVKEIEKKKLIIGAGILLASIPAAITLVHMMHKGTIVSPELNEKFKKGFKSIFTQNRSNKHKTGINNDKNTNHGKKNKTLSSSNNELVSFIDKNASIHGKKTDKQIKIQPAAQDPAPTKETLKKSNKYPENPGKQTPAQGQIPNKEEPKKETHIKRIQTIEPATENIEPKLPQEQNKYGIEVTDSPDKQAKTHLTQETKATKHPDIPDKKFENSDNENSDANPKALINTVIHNPETDNETLLNILENQAGTSSLKPALNTRYFQSTIYLNAEKNYQKIINGEFANFTPEELGLIMQNEIRGTDCTNSPSSREDLKQYLLTGDIGIIAGLKEGMRLLKKGNEAKSITAQAVDKNLEELNRILDEYANPKVKTAIGDDLKAAISKEIDLTNICSSKGFKKRISKELNKLTEEELVMLVKLNEEDCNIFLDYLTGSSETRISEIKRAVRKFIKQTNAGISKTDRTAQDICELMRISLPYKWGKAIESSNVTRIIAESNNNSGELYDLIEANTRELGNDFDFEQFKVITNKYTKELAEYLTSSDDKHEEIYEKLRDKSLYDIALSVYKKKGAKDIVSRNLPNTRRIFFNKDLNEILPKDTLSEDFLRNFAKNIEAYNISGERVLTNAERLRSEDGVSLDAIKLLANSSNNSENGLLISFLINGTKEDFAQIKAFEAQNQQLLEKIAAEAKTKLYSTSRNSLNAEINNVAKPENSRGIRTPAPASDITVAQPGCASCINTKEDPQAIFNTFDRLAQPLETNPTYAAI